jgi:hypothetical protein
MEERQLAREGRKVWGDHITGSSKKVLHSVYIDYFRNHLAMITDKNHG